MVGREKVHFRITSVPLCVVIVTWCLALASAEVGEGVSAPQAGNKARLISYQLLPDWRSGAT